MGGQTRPKHDKLESRCGNHEAELTVLKSNLESMRDDILTHKEYFSA